MCSCNDFPIVLGLVEDNMFHAGCMACYLIVAVDIRRCHWIQWPKTWSTREVVIVDDCDVC